MPTITERRDSVVSAASDATDNPVVQQFLVRIAGQESRFGDDLLDESGQRKNNGSRGVTQIDFGTFASLLNHRTQGARIRKMFGLSADASGEVTLLAWDRLSNDVPLAMKTTRALLATNPIPIPRSLEAQAGYWKAFYNTELGRGRPRDFVRNNTYLEHALLDKLAMFRCGQFAGIFQRAKDACVLQGDVEALNTAATDVLAYGER